MGEVESKCTFPVMESQFIRPYPDEWGNGYYVETPSGGDYTTCPVCTKSCCCRDPPGTNELCKHQHFDNTKYEGAIHYCRSCKILFSWGCTHACMGCTDDIYYGMLISSFTYKGTKYTGQPVIPNDFFNDFLVELTDVEFKCTCFLNGCEVFGYYPPDKYPQYYRCYCGIRQ